LLRILFANVLRSGSGEIVMARPLNLLDWIIIAVLVIVAAVLIYLLRPLVIVIAIAAVGYLIYRWYTGRRVVRVS
jgi:hypothetical protein